MALLSLEIPDVLVPSALEYIPLYLSYQDMVTDMDEDSPTYNEMIPNPTSKVDWIKMALLRNLKEMYKAGKVQASNIDIEQVRIDADEETAEFDIA